MTWEDLNPLRAETDQHWWGLFKGASWLSEWGLFKGASWLSAKATGLGGGPVQTRGGVFSASPDPDSWRVGSDSEWDEEARAGSQGSTTGLDLRPVSGSRVWKLVHLHKLPYSIPLDTSLRKLELFPSCGESA